MASSTCWPTTGNGIDSTATTSGFSDSRLRAAMLTDLYLTGRLEDRGGKPYPSSVGCPDDPVLSAAFDQIGATGRRDWAQLIALNEKKAPQVVRDQLEATGWLRVRRRRMLAIIPTARVVGLYGEDMVRGLADQVTAALRTAILGQSAAPRLLALGLLGVLGQMPTVLSFKETSRHRQELRALTFAAPPQLWDCTRQSSSITKICVATVWATWVRGSRCERRVRHERSEDHRLPQEIPHDALCESRNLMWSGCWGGCVDAIHSESSALGHQ